MNKPAYEDLRSPIQSLSCSLRMAVCVAFATCLAMDVSPAKAQLPCQSWDPSFSALTLDWPRSLEGEAFDMIVYDDGSGPRIYAGGTLETEAPTWGRNVAIWNGTSWDAPFAPLGDYDDIVSALAFFDRGDGLRLYAGGAFSHGGSDNLASWDGVNFLWTPEPWPFGPAPFVYIRDMKTYDDGTGPSLYVGGHNMGIKRWDGWSAYAVGGGVNGDVFTMEVWDDGTGPKLYVGGAFTQAGGISVTGLASWDGANWSAVGPTNQPGVAALRAGDMGQGDVLFVVRATGVGRIDAQGWTTIGQPNGGVSDMEVFDDGSGRALFVAGSFTSIGSVPASRIAKWDGQLWHAVGAGFNSDVTSLAAYPDPTGPALHVAGRFSFAGPLYYDYNGAWRACSQAIELMCPGDGTLTYCPCSPLGTAANGCPNSASAAGASLRAVGTPALDDVQFTLMNVPQSSLTMLVQADGSRTGNLRFGDGLLCLDGRLVRMWTRTASNGSVLVPDVGDPSVLMRSAVRGDPLMPGDVRYYQAYYRDVSPTWCPAPTGGTFNASNGVRVVW
jgi:hypothetical protein